MATTTVLNLEKLRLPSLDANSDSVTANRPWTYTGAIGPPAKVRILFDILITSLRFIVHQYVTFFSACNKLLLFEAIYLEMHLVFVFNIIEHFAHLGPKPVHLVKA